MSTLFLITDEMRLIFKEYYKETPESLQEVLVVLRSKNVSQMQSVRLLMDELNLSLGEANAIVLNSKAWKGDE